MPRPSWPTQQNYITGKGLSRHRRGITSGSEALSIWAEWSSISVMPIRVMLVDDNDALRSALRAIVDGQADLECVADVPDGASALRDLERAVPDVVVMDIDLPDMPGPNAVSAIRAQQPGMGVVYFSGAPLDDALRNSIGDDVFLTKSSSSDQILEAIRNAIPARAVVGGVSRPDALPFNRSAPPTAPLLAGLLQDLAALTVRASTAASDVAAQRRGQPADLDGGLEALLGLSSTLARAQHDLAAALAAAIDESRDPDALR